MGLKEWVVPQDQIFFDLFDQLSAVVVSAAEELVGIVDNFEKVTEKQKIIVQLEHEGDKITHQIYEQLNRNFITPLEPEEISRLASALDDILDYIDDSAQKMENYDIDKPDAHMRELAEIIRLSVVQLEDTVKSIRKIKDSRAIEAQSIEVNRLENLADDVLAHAVNDLFKTKDAITIIKLKDIYECLETATDKCEDVANVLSDIAIKHS